jgi:hypothetical protein
VNPPFGPFFHPSIPLLAYKHTVIQQINKKILNMGKAYKMLEFRNECKEVPENRNSSSTGTKKNERQDETQYRN